MEEKHFYSLTELDSTNYPEFNAQIIAFGNEAPPFLPRTYPGYPSWKLLRQRPRRTSSLEKTMQQRRSAWELGTTPPSKKIFSSIVQFSHATFLPTGQGPTPSAGNLQGLELYCIFLTSSWIPEGLYHYNRRDHLLAQLNPKINHSSLKKIIPSLHHVQGGSILWVLVGDTSRILTKYSERGLRFLLLESGHLMQNLTLLSSSYGYTTVPFGGYFEAQLAELFVLPPQDIVTYVGICG